MSQNQKLIAVSPYFFRQNPNEQKIESDDAMQIDLLPDLSPFGGHENLVTAMVVFCRHFFAYPTSNQDPETTAKFKTHILTKHAYLPTTLISDKRSAYVSQVTKEVGITLKQATINQGKKLGCLKDLTLQSNKRWRLKKASIVAKKRQHCGP